MYYTPVCLFSEQMSVKKGLKTFGKKGADAVVAEMQQLHFRKVIEPLRCGQLTSDQKKAALRYLMFLKQKRCWKIKTRGCADGRIQRLYKGKDKSTLQQYTINPFSCPVS